MYPAGRHDGPAFGADAETAGSTSTAINRQQPIDDDHLNAEDNLEEFGPITAEALAHVKHEVERLLALG